MAASGSGDQSDRDACNQSIIMDNVSETYKNEQTTVKENFRAFYEFWNEVIIVRDTVYKIIIASSKKHLNSYPYTFSFSCERYLSFFKK